MILILEDDADREAYQSRNPFDAGFYDEALRAGVRVGVPTVWISPEAYAKDVVLADLRAQVATFADGLHISSYGVGYDKAIRDVLALIGGSDE